MRGRPPPEETKAHQQAYIIHTHCLSSLLTHYYFLALNHRQWTAEQWNAWASATRWAPTALVFECDETKRRERINKRRSAAEHKHDAAAYEERRHALRT